MQPAGNPANNPLPKATFGDIWKADPSEDFGKKVTVTAELKGADGSVHVVKIVGSESALRAQFNLDKSDDLGKIIEKITKDVGADEIIKLSGQKIKMEFNDLKKSVITPLGEADSKGETITKLETGTDDEKKRAATAMKVIKLFRTGMQGIRPVTMEVQQTQAAPAQQQPPQGDVAQRRAPEPPPRQRSQSQPAERSRPLPDSQLLPRNRRPQAQIPPQPNQERSLDDVDMLKHDLIGGSPFANNDNGSLKSIIVLNTIIAEKYSEEFKQEQKEAIANTVRLIPEVTKDRESQLDLIGQIKNEKARNEVRVKLGHPEAN